MVENWKQKRDQEKEIRKVGNGKRANEIIIEELQNWMDCVLMELNFQNMNKYFTLSGQMEYFQIMSTVNYLFFFFVYLHNNCIVVPPWRSYGKRKEVKIVTKFWQKTVFISRPEYILMLASCWMINAIHIGFVHVLFSRDKCAVALYFEAKKDLPWCTNQFTMNSMQKKRLSKLFIHQRTQQVRTNPEIEKQKKRVVQWDMRLFQCDCPSYPIHIDSSNTIWQSE